MAANIIYDPWQLVHKPWFREAYFINHARFQNAGLINNYEFNSAIIGGSEAINFSAKEASQLFKAYFINLSIVGSFKSEQDLTVKYLFHKKSSVKNIIYIINYAPDIPFDKTHDRIDFDSFSFLYDKKPVNDLKIYLNPGILLCIGRSHCSSLSHDRNMDLEEVYKRHFNHFGIEQWVLKRDKLQVADTLRYVLEGAALQRTASPTYPSETKYLVSTSTEDATEKSLDDTSLKQQFEYYVLKYVQKYPDTNFFLSFIPRSRVFYSKRFWGEKFDLYQIWQKYIVTKAAKYSNLQVYGFGNESFLDNLNNYRDGTHFHIKINSLMLKRMAGGKNRLTPGNIDKYLGNTRQKAKSYDLSRIAESVCTLLKTQQVLKKERYNWKVLCYKATKKSF